MNITPTYDTPVPDGYRPAHLYLLMEGTGCGGPHHTGWVLTPPGTSVGDVERVWKAAEGAYNAVPAPQLPQLPAFNSWEGTVGEHREAERSAREERDRISGTHHRQRREAEQAVWDASGYQRVTFTTSPHYQGVDWDDEEEPTPGVPVAVVWERGCRCGHGGTWPADWNANGDVVGPVVAVHDSSERSHILLWNNGFDTDVEAAFCDADAARQERLLEIRRRNTEIEWAATLTADDIDKMTVPEFRHYESLLAKSWATGRKRPIAKPISDDDALTAANADADAAAAVHAVYMYTGHPKGGTS